MPFRKPASPSIRLDETAPATEAQEFFTTLEVESGIAQTWDTPQGAIAVVFPNSFYSLALNRHHWQSWLAQFDQCRAVILVGGGRSLTGGPDLFVHDRQATEEPSMPYHYEITWAELNNLLGQEAPYWATYLRTPTGMAGWHPTEGERVIAAAPEIDLGPVLRLAARHAPDTALHQALMEFARGTLADAANAAVRDIAFHREDRDKPAIRFAARPADVAEPTGPLDPAAIRAGWLHVLELADDDAYESAALALSREQSSMVLPATTLANIKADEDGAAEWIARLRPCQRTAKFAVFPAKYVRTTLIDPFTQTVVAFDGTETYLAAVPSRLPSASPLSSVELRPDRVWIRTEDGTKYLCPETYSVDVNWGYKGAGPRMLAQVLHGLLDDINIDLVVGLANPPVGLVALCTHAWEPGTVLSRKQLEAAREG